MRLTKKRTHTEILTKNYLLSFYPGEKKAILKIPGKRFYYVLPLLAACNKPGKIDFTEDTTPLIFRKESDSIILSFEEKSSLWNKKTHIITMTENEILYKCIVEGKGKVDKIYFFRGFKNGKESGSAPGFDRIFSAAPNFHEKMYFHPSDYITIDAGISEFAGGNCLASPYYFYGLNDSRENIWVGVGPAVKPGENQFDSFEMNPRCKINQTKWAPDNMLGGGFAYVYNGHLKIDGEYKFPPLLFTFGNSEWDVLKKHSTYSRKKNLIPNNKRRVPKKWLEPIFCGWHEQVAITFEGAKRDDEMGTSVFNTATQKNYRRWLKILEKNNCKPGTIIIDAQWQLDKGNNIVNPQKFPDLRGFIDKCHRDNQLVLLWIDLWNKEGVPDDECILQDGKAKTVDPTNPKYEERLRKSIRRIILSEDKCYNADGIKVDGMLNLRIGKNLKVKGNLYGLELQKKILLIISDEAKKCKKGAIIQVFTPHPYLSDVIDMVRLGDMYTVKASCEDSMLHRARIYKTLMPGVPIDTDGQFVHNILKNWRDIFELQAKIGIPTLYCAENAYHSRFFSGVTVDKLKKEDYKFFSKVIVDYRKRMAIG